MRFGDHRALYHVPIVIIPTLLIIVYMPENHWATADTRTQIGIVTFMTGIFAVYRYKISKENKIYGR
jgi:hypothetical protein